MTTEREIIAELRRSFEYLVNEHHGILGAPLDKDKIYDTLEALGADPYLLGAVGSWGNTIDDDEVLGELRRWNAESGRDAAFSA